MGFLPFFAFIVAAGAAAQDPKPYRSISDCLIRVEQLERNLRAARVEIVTGGCTTKPDQG